MAYNEAIKDMKTIEREKDKMMYDPNVERIMKKRRTKQKLKILLLRCSRLKLEIKDIKTVTLFSIVPY